MPIFARYLAFYSEQYDESYVFKICVFRSIYSSAKLASLWAIIWYTSMLKWVFQCDAAWQNWRCPWGKISLSEAAGSVTRSWSRIGGDGTGYLPHVHFSFFSLPCLIPEFKHVTVFGLSPVWMSPVCSYVRTVVVQVFQAHFIYQHSFLARTSSK